MSEASMLLFYHQPNEIKNPISHEIGFPISFALNLKLQMRLKVLSHTRQDFLSRLLAKAAIGISKHFVNTQQRRDYIINQSEYQNLQDTVSYWLRKTPIKAWNSQNQIVSPPFFEQNYEVSYK